MFHFDNISSYHLQLQQNETTCISAVSHFLSKIEASKHLNAFVEVYGDEALEKARQLDELRSSGVPLKKLHGVVIAIKDVICYKDHKVSASSAILKDFTSLYTATALQLLIDEDAIIIGNCNCDEFAMGSTNENSVYGKVLNAADNNRSPGGSSGGSAVAVQADMCMASLGSDTGGSVRQPADFCGIIGLKPGYGRISRHGLIAYASSFDQIGIFAKDINDAGLLLEVMSKPDEFDSTMITTPLDFKSSIVNDKKYRFCFFKQALEHPSLDPEIAKSITTLLSDLKKEGHVVKEIEFDLLDYIVPAYYILTTAEASSNLSRYDGVRYGYNIKEGDTLIDMYCRNRTEGFGAEVKRRIMLGTFVLSAGYYDAYFNKAQQVRGMLVNQVKDIFKEYDAIISPTSPTPAVLFERNNIEPIETYLADIYTVLANLTGIPGTSVPLFSHSYKIPYGIQVMTNNRDEVSLLSISNMLLERTNTF
jgi:aspartyl-tRNA(Asn)/glutamyl-tRNA(Gln) amidotransferase subunit A